MKSLLVFLLLVPFLAGCSRHMTDPQPQMHITEQTPDAHQDISDLQQQTQQKKPNVQQNQQEKVILHVPIIRQNPELKYGCEVTSLAMVLQYAGIQVDKLKLAQKIEKDQDPLGKKNSGDIIHWGNPNHGFVGDITGKSEGYAVYDQPTERLMRQYLPDQTVNLTGRPFDDLIQQIRKQKPVLVWTTANYKRPNSWESWNHQGETIQVTFDLHTVVLVGFDSDSVYINDPLTGKQAQKVSKQSFLVGWTALGKKALSYN